MKRPLLWGVVLFVIACIAFFPLSLAMQLAGLSRFGISAEGARGSIWSGRLEGAQLGDIPLGDLDVRLSAPALLTGKLRLAIRGEGAQPLAGSLFTGLSGFGADGLSGTAPMIGIPPLPGGTVSLDGVRFAFSGKSCIRAEGQVRIALEGGALPFAKSMIGTLRCERADSDGDAIGVAMTGASAMEKLTLRVRPDGVYATSLIIPAPDPETAAQLRLLGFRETQAGFVVTISGRI